MKLITIGRDNSCDIVINDDRVSRVHAEVEFVTETMFNQIITHYLFHDKSSNGTLVNGKYIRNQSIVVYESFPYTSPVKPHILLAGTIPISWTIIMNEFSDPLVTACSPHVNNYNPSQSIKSSEGLPENMHGWNWGAFTFSWLWAVCNGIYWPLVVFKDKCKNGKEQNTMSNKEVILKFCILCGQSVKPYHYSQCVYSDIFDYGNSIDSPHYKLVSGVVTYDCSCSKEEILAPNTFNTGFICPVCGHFMPVFVNFCGVCGMKRI